MSPSEIYPKVFGIGLSRTGTSTLSEALNLLGIPSIHFPHDEQTLIELKRGDYAFSLLHRYQAITDTTVVPFYPQLDRIWPGSKFILTVRDKASWLHSVERHWRHLGRHPEEPDDARHQPMIDFVNTCVYGCTYFNVERFSYVYDMHDRAVREYFAGRQDDLLVLDICGGDGWEPLSDFLGRPMPRETPFPRSNAGGLRASRPRMASAEWARLVADASESLAQVVHSNQGVVLVDEERLRHQLAGSWRVLPFLERDGQYWGLPENDASAIRELERVRSEHGTAFLAVVAPSFWILEEYALFGAHVRSRYNCVLTNPRLMVFDLRL